MKKKGIHFLYGQQEAVTDYKSIVQRFAVLGMNCIEFPPEPFLKNRTELHEIKEMALAHHIEIIFSCGFSAEYDMASENAAVREKGVEHLKQILDLMAEEDIRFMGGTFYTKWPSSRAKILTPAEKQKISERTAKCVRTAVEGIQQSNIELALEPLNRFEGFLINTAQEGVDFCEMVDNSKVGLMLDGFHMSVEEDSIVQAVLTAGPLLKHVHLAENNRRLPGTGSFPWDEYFQALKEIDYKGRLDIESFITAGGSVSASVALWRSLDGNASQEQQNDMLRKSLEFIDEKCRIYGL